MPFPKYLARDAELLTAGSNPDGCPLHQWDVAQALLAHAGAAFDALGHEPWQRHEWGGSYYRRWRSPMSTDCHRNWAPNGQCYYCDMSHWEGCTAETKSPRAFAAQCLSALQVAEAARRRAEEEDGNRYTLSAHNVDATDPGISWGTHLNASISPELWHHLFRDQRNPAVLGFVSSAIAAGVAFFGTGYLLPLADGLVYSTSARAHHLTRMSTIATTEAYKRGLLNSRHEPHSESDARMHLIGFDYSLGSAALLCSYLQCVLAAAEEDYCQLMLFDPVHAARHWSWGVDLGSGKMTTTAGLIDGRQMTLPAFMRELCGKLLEMVEAGLIPADVAPQADELLPRIIGLTHYAEEGSLPRCARHLDWAAKLLTLLNMAGGGNKLGDPETVIADQDYLNTDPQRGIFWNLWESDLVDPLVTEEEVEACLLDGPEESRAWGRGRLIQGFSDAITRMDWDVVELRKNGSRWSPRLKIDMPDLDSHSRCKFQRIIQQAGSVDELEYLLEEEYEEPAHHADPVLEAAPQGSGPRNEQQGNGEGASAP